MPIQRAITFSWAPPITVDDGRLACEDRDKPHAFAQGARAPPLARYVVLQLINGEFLLVDRRLDEVADRDQPYDAAVLDDRQVAYSALGHQRHAVFDRVRGPNADD